MHILALNGMGNEYSSHDSSACLITNGKLVSFVQEERLTRQKQTGALPMASLRWTLENANLSMEDIDHAVWPRKEVLYPLHVIRETLRRRRSFGGLKYIAGIDHKYWASKVRRTRMISANIVKKRLEKLDHHFCHAGAAFLISPFDEAAILTMDAHGEWTATMLAAGRGNRIVPLERIGAPNSIGNLWATMTEFLGFNGGSDEWKVMGLAAYGDADEFLPVFKRLIRLNQDGLYDIDGSHLGYRPAMLHFRCTRELEKLFGKRRSKNEPMEARHACIAAALQQVTNLLYLHLAETLRKRTKMKNLCIAGGVALNSVANGCLEVSGIFENLYIPPVAADDGITVGAAFYFYNSVLGKPRVFTMEHAYWGPEFSNEEIEALLKLSKVKYRRVKNPSQVAAELIANGNIVGWFQGAMEGGPRALGNRSILADPRDPCMKDKINKYVKYREEFRPFAPSILEERVGEFFEHNGVDPFMVKVFMLKNEKRAVIPAVTHVDGSGRIQTVSNKTNPRFWDLIHHFESLTGVPVVLNTSFNISGEPIVCTPVDSLRTFYTSGIDYLVLGDYLASKEDILHWHADGSLR